MNTDALKNLIYIKDLEIMILVKIIDRPPFDG